MFVTSTQETRNFPRAVYSCLFIGVALGFVALSCSSDAPSAGEWPEYLGGPDRNHYSALSQIDTSNVNKLAVAWEYHTSDSGQLQCSPIMVNGVLYGMTARTLPFAVDAATGKEIWSIRDDAKSTWYGTSRGLAYWENGDDKRIIYTKESWLHAVNAVTGKPVLAFGDSGRVHLGAGLGARAKSRFVISNTPGTVFDDLIIMPLRISEGIDALPGYIQAFNIKTGELAWVFRTIPHPGEAGYDTWPANTWQDSTIGAANNWSGMAIDRERAIVYVPTGSAAFDFYGGDRKGSNLFANTLLALNARTGKLIWHYQFVHHDILDRDAPAPPNLLTVTHDGKRIDAVAQVTKQGYVFLFDRVTGKPLFDIEEVPVPASDVPGEEAWPTQPRPVKPAPYARQVLTSEEIHSTSEGTQDSLLAKFNASRHEGPFTPLSLRGTIIFPGLDGGAEWGGAAVDPNGIMYINSSEMPWLISLQPASDLPDEGKMLAPGEQVYAKNCSACHGTERKGNKASGFPSLVDLGNRFQRNHVLDVISKGKGMMPAFRQLTEDDKKVLVAYLFGDKINHTEKVKEQKKEPGHETKGFNISGYTKFLDDDGYPAITPPWGSLNAIDLNTGEYVWKNTFGEHPELMRQGIAQTGAESYGGPVITAGGILFIAGTKDGKFRAYSSKTGKLLWETKLPAAAFATPCTYEVNGRQYVVIACGGTKLGAAKGDSYVAFALPD
jgi:quinoprotein glucose dehydrogenase